MVAYPNNQQGLQRDFYHLPTDQDSLPSLIHSENSDDTNPNVNTYLPTFTTFLVVSPSFLSQHTFFVTTASANLSQPASDSISSA